MTQSEKSPTILLTGGHVTPAVATISSLRKKCPSCRIVFVGRAHALESSRELSEESRIIEQMGIPFFPLTAGRLKRDGGIMALVSLAKIPLGFIQAWSILRKERPTVVVTFGGYVGFPVAIVARMLHIPVIIHEQTARAGLANRIIARIADKVCVTFPETEKTLSLATKAIVTGLPVRHSIQKTAAHPSFEVPQDVPILLIVGGNTGSVSVNEIVYGALTELLNVYTVVHQVGRVSIQKATHVASSLSDTQKARYVPCGYLSEQDYAWLVQHAHIIIGRSGANTVIEAAIAGLVGVWIPLPWAAYDEQTHNAMRLVAAGSSILTPQQQLNADGLVGAIRRVEEQYADMKKAADTYSRKIPTNGADRLADVILSVVA